MKHQFNKLTLMLSVLFFLTATSVADAQSIEHFMQQYASKKEVTSFSLSGSFLANMLNDKLGVEGEDFSSINGIRFISIPTDKYKDARLGLKSQLKQLRASGAEELVSTRSKDGKFYVFGDPSKKNVFSSIAILIEGDDNVLAVQLNGSISQKAVDKMQADGDWDFN